MSRAEVRHSMHAWVLAYDRHNSMCEKIKHPTGDEQDS